MIPECKVDEIRRLLGKGLSDREIAIKLDVSRATVAGIRSGVRDRMPYVSRRLLQNIDEPRDSRTVAQRARDALVAAGREKAVYE